MQIVFVTMTGSAYRVTVDPSIDRAVVDLREPKWTRFFTEALTPPVPTAGEIKLTVADLQGDKEATVVKGA